MAGASACRFFQPFHSAFQASAHVLGGQRYCFDIAFVGPQIHCGHHRVSGHHAGKGRGRRTQAPDDAGAKEWKVNLTILPVFLQNEVVSLLKSLMRAGVNRLALGMTLAAGLLGSKEALADKKPSIQDFAPQIEAIGMTVAQVIEHPNSCGYLGLSTADATNCEIAAIRAKREAVETRETDLDKTIATVQSERDAAQAILAAVEEERAKN